MPRCAAGATWCVQAAGSCSSRAAGARAPTGGTPWSGGVTAATLSLALRDLVTGLRVEPLTDPRLWGKHIDDERYALIATC
ncbi:hypothetical protein [Nonomuraea roseola]|uniref:hypothetical protein n=1 Tax=Nonomuraea roseola TaxID=46179 RepID=UPI0031F9D654